MLGFQAIALCAGWGQRGETPIQGLTNHIRATLHRQNWHIRASPTLSTSHLLASLGKPRFQTYASCQALMAWDAQHGGRFSEPTRLICSRTGHHAIPAIPWLIPTPPGRAILGSITIPLVSGLSKISPSRLNTCMHLLISDASDRSAVPQTRRSSSDYHFDDASVRHPCFHTSPSP